jgi:uncharacterized protein (DUF1800 family)
MPEPKAEIAVTRFAYGALPGDMAQAAAAPLDWLQAQLKPLSFDRASGHSSEVLRLFAAFREEKQGRRKDDNNVRDQAATDATEEKARRRIVELARDMSLEALDKAIAGSNSFAARLLEFFSNHFSVSDQNILMRGLAPTLEREAIAPGLTGRFEDMLLAVEQHPAMLTYLNNAQSIGPGSRAGLRREKGLNENLAREILELHTLGVDGGYVQADVRELAMAITGWSISRAGDEAPGFVFRAVSHEPGARRLLGTVYAAGDKEQGETMLRDLARHPATARHLSFKLARHFIADEPPQPLVAAMAQRWQAAQGELREVIATMLAHPLAWDAAQRKLKTPRDFVISACRGAGEAGKARAGLLDTLGALGQRPFTAGSPAGFGDTAAAWDGSEALMLRIDWAWQLAARTRGEPLALARAALGNLLAEPTMAAMRGAESRQQAIALFLMSPEFQRR